MGGREGGRTRVGCQKAGPSGIVLLPDRVSSIDYRVLANRLLVLVLVEFVFVDFRS